MNIYTHPHHLPQAINPKEPVEDDGDDPQYVVECSPKNLGSGSVGDG